MPITRRAAARVDRWWFYSLDAAWRPRRYEVVFHPHAQGCGNTRRGTGRRERGVEGAHVVRQQGRGDRQRHWVLHGDARGVGRRGRRRRLLSGDAPLPPTSTTTRAHRERRGLPRMPSGRHRPASRLRRRGEHRGAQIRRRPGGIPQSSCPTRQAWRLVRLHGAPDTPEGRRYRRDELTTRRRVSLRSDAEIVAAAAVAGMRLETMETAAHITRVIRAAAE